MIDSLFNFLYESLTGSIWIAIFASFGWGVLSIILSPCHLSSIPLIIGYITSYGKISIFRTFLISLVFSIGILLTIVIIGLITSLLGRLLGDIGSLGNYFVALIFFIVGLYLLGLIKLNWDTIGLKSNKSGIVGALILGLLFGLALGPCTFAYLAPILGVVFQTSQTDYLFAILLLSAFAVGHCLVIVVAGTTVNLVQSYLNWSNESKAIIIVKKTCGILVIIGGFYLIFGI